MIKSFDKQNLKQLRIDLDAAFAIIRQKHGVNVSIGNISYSPEAGGKATSRLTMVAIGDPNVASDPRAAALAKAQADFKRNASSFGLKPEQFGAIFKYGRDTYKLAGINPRASVRPISGTSVTDGKTYVFPETAIVSLQSKEHKELYNTSESYTSAAVGRCSNDQAFDKNFKSIGQCPRAATTSRKIGFGRAGLYLPYCAECAQLMDESRREMAAEARGS